MFKRERNNCTTWGEIAEYLNERKVPTLSGESIWTESIAQELFPELNTFEDMFEDQDLTKYDPRQLFSIIKVLKNETGWTYERIASYLNRKGSLNVKGLKWNSSNIKTTFSNLSKKITDN